MTFEFNDAENIVLGRVARWARLLAWVMIASAALMVVGSLFTEGPVAIGALMVAPIFLVIGFNVRSAATSMRSVIETAGADIVHLMEALDRFASALKVIAVLFLLGVVLFGASLVLLGTLYPV